MKNTKTLALSLTAIKQDITAQCAWVDATNLATLPPIVNPADNSDSDTAIRAAVNMICNRLSGYIVDTSQNDDVFTLTINLPKLSSEHTSSLLRLITDCVTTTVLAELYSTQQQANHITALFRDKRDMAIRRIIQLLAYTN